MAGALIAPWCVTTLGVARESHDAPVASARAGSGGQIDLSFNRDALAGLGLRVDDLRRDHVLLGLQAGARPLQVVLGDGAPTAFGEGVLELPGLRLRRDDGRRTPLLQVVAGDGLDLSLRDARGAEWMKIAYAMRSPDLARDGLRFHTADLRVGPALAAFAQQPDATGRILANASLRMPLTVLDADARPKTCAAPVWNGVGAAVTDVQLTNIDAIDVLRCRQVVGGGVCDGAGGSVGEVVIVPSATLRNSDAPNAADVPWYTKFTGPFAPYGNDQHPYLIWNLYRIDSAGRIDQIARSGLKHAFATANSGCVDATCVPNGHILGRGCSDLYNAASNDCATFLGPRADLIPSRGQWGRCGSIHDDDCDGVQSPPVGGGFCSPPNTSPAGDGYSFRLAAREPDIDPALHGGARWLIDAWYLVRDDADIFNTMGSREIFPASIASGPRWTVGTPGAFLPGPVIDRWREAVTVAGDEWLRSDVSEAEGRVAVAARAHRLPDGRWQYDYAVTNFDFARVATDPASAEPNLRILSNVGLDALELELRNGAASDSAELRDGDAEAANDWTDASVAGMQRWTAPAGNRLDWGQLLFVRVVSAAAPGNGTLQLRVAAAGSPSHLQVTTLVPDAGNVFRDDFE